MQQGKISAYLSEQVQELLIHKFTGKKSFGCFRSLFCLCINQKAVLSSIQRIICSVFSQTTWGVQQILMVNILKTLTYNSPLMLDLAFLHIKLML